MAAWSAENATKAYLKTMKMGKCAKELNGAEFISALAAGNNSQVIVITCAGRADSTTLALAAAAQQTGGRVICILRGLDQLRECQKTLGGTMSSRIQFVVDDGKKKLLNHYENADFVAIDCNLDNHEEILNSVQESERKNNTMVIGYNAFCKESWRSSHFQTQLLPIGNGLLVKRIVAGGKSRGIDHNNNNNNNRGLRKTGRWIVRVDKCTGEEHVFRARSNERRAIHA